MMKCIATVLVIVFMFASSGLHKLVDYSADTSTHISFSQDVESSKFDTCCDHDDAHSELEKPRCLGDNCLSYSSVLSVPEAIWVRMDIVYVPSLPETEMNEFLRPPIT